MFEKMLKVNAKKIINRRGLFTEVVLQSRNCHQRRRLAAGLEFEKRRAQLKNPVKKIELKIILN